MANPSPLYDIIVGPIHPAPQAIVLNFAAQIYYDDKLHIQYIRGRAQVTSARKREAGVGKKLTISDEQEGGRKKLTSSVYHTKTLCALIELHTFYRRVATNFFEQFENIQKCLKTQIFPLFDSKIFELLKMNSIKIFSNVCGIRKKIEFF